MHTVHNCATFMINRHVHRPAGPSELKQQSMILGVQNMVRQVQNTQLAGACSNHGTLIPLILFIFKRATF